MTNRNLANIIECMTKAARHSQEGLINARIALQVSHLEKPVGDYDGCIYNTIDSIQTTRQWLDGAEAILTAGRDFHIYDYGIIYSEDFCEVFLSLPDPADADDTRVKHIMDCFRFHIEASPRSMYYIDRNKALLTVATFDWEQTEGTPATLHLYQYAINEVKVMQEHLKQVASKQGIAVVTGS